MWTRSRQSYFNHVAAGCFRAALSISHGPTQAKGHAIGAKLCAIALAPRHKIHTSGGTLTITDNSAGSPHTVQLTGTGGQPSVVPSPATLSFASQSIGTSSPAQTVTLTNAGALSAQITQIQVSGDFAETNTCPLTLNPTATCTIQVTFTPTASGTRTGSLVITDSAPNSPHME